MPIKKPGRVLLHHVPLKFVRNKVVGGGRRSVDAAIALVPFIDFLITLVVFLLQSFNASGELVPQRPGLMMPTARNTLVLESAPIVSIDSRTVTLDGRRVADTNNLAASATLEPIDALIQGLEQAHRQWAIIHPNEEFQGVAILQADENTDFRVIRKVMASIGRAGFTNTSFVVNSSGD